MTAAHDRAFLADILAHPEDDAPRLIYADWLTDHGNPERGELIRVQIERARIDEDDPAQDEVERREKQLLNRHPEWLAALPKWAREGAVFRCGFPDAVRGTARQTRTGLERVLLQAPVRDVTIELSRDRPLQALTPSERLAGVRRLFLRNDYVRYQDSIHKGFWDAFPGLEELALSVEQFSPPNARALLASALAGRLRQLCLRPALNNPRSRRVILANRALFAPLEALELSNNWLEEADFTKLAALPMPQLRSFRWEASWAPAASFLTELLSGGRRPLLSSLSIVAQSGTEAEEVAAALAAAPGLDRLRELHVGQCNLGHRVLHDLIKRNRFTHLRHLTLDYNPLGSTGARMLAACPRLASLTRLSLMGTRIRPQGVAALARSRHLRNLRRLDLSYIILEDEGVRALVERHTLPPLAELGLENNYLTDAGLRALVESDVEMPVRLNLSHNRISSKGVALLARSPRSRRLGEFLLHGNILDDKSYRALAESPYLDGLWRLQVRWHRELTVPAGIARLRERLGAALVDPG
jgi:uncharacterized protein (TIGR02996 family)